MDRTIVAITGASSGIGEAFARKLAPGHDLILIARRADRLQALSDEFANKFGTHTEIQQADLTVAEDLERVAERIAGEARLALLVNNAGFGTRGRFWEADLASQEKMHKLHVDAVLRLTHAALKNMVPRDLGVIINVASVSSFLRNPGSVSYSATKAWMAAFTEGLYLELKDARSNVVVQALCPGFTYSEFHEAMGAGRTNGMGPAWWHTAEEVVDASIEGLQKRKLFVVPGWRYKLVTAIVSRLPVGLRTKVESIREPSQPRQLPINVDSRKQIGDE